MTRPRMLDGIKACIFDMDGTLVDSLGIWGDIDVRFFKERGFDSVPEGYDKAISHMSFMEMAVYTHDTYHCKETPEEIAQIWIDWSIDAYKNTILAKPGTKEFLAYLKSLGLPLALATTNKSELYESCLERNGMFEYFDFCMNVNDINSSKREPKIYQLLAEKMNAKPNETLVFEDILMAINTAKDAGFKVAAVYDKYNQKDMEKIIERSDFFISSYEEINKKFGIK